MYSEQFWARSSASVSVRLWDFKSISTVLSHLIRRRPGGLFQPSGGRKNNLLSVYVVMSMSIIDLYSEESWSISTALCVLSGNDEIGSSSTIVWNCCLLSICATSPKRKRLLDWTAEARSDWMVLCWTSALETNWYHLIPSSLHRHHWSRTSIFRASPLVMGQHSEPYSVNDAV